MEVENLNVESDTPVGGDKPSDSAVDWSFLNDQDDVDDGTLQEKVVTAPVAETKPKEPAAPPSVEPPKVPAVTPEAKAVEPQTAPAPTPEVKPLEAPAPVVEAKAPEPAPVTQTAEQKLAQRDSLIGELARQYQLDQKDADALMTNPNEVLPRLAARLRVDIMDQIVPAIMQGFAQQLPGLIEHHFTSKQQATQNEDVFFSKWEELKPHKAIVEEAARLYRSANPSTPLEQAVQEIGVLAWQKAKLSMPALLNKLADRPSGQPAAAPRAPQGYAPAGVATTPRAPAPGQLNAFEKLLEEFSRDEDS